MLFNFKSHYETNTDPLPEEFVIMLKEMFLDISNHTISNKHKLHKKIISKWNLKSVADYQLGIMLCYWHHLGRQEFSAKYNRSTTDHQENEIIRIAEEYGLELHEEFKTLD